MCVPIVLCIFEYGCMYAWLCDMGCKGMVDEFCMLGNIINKFKVIGKMRIEVISVDEMSWPHYGSIIPGLVQLPSSE
jgi:hypothetical protein